MTFTKFLAATGLAVSLAGPVAANDQLANEVKNILPKYGYTNVDISELNSAQLAQIKHLAGSNKGVPTIAAPNAQLVRSVEHRLSIIGFKDVDGSALTTAQVGALHMRLQGNYTFGLNRIRAQQDVKVILQWTE